MSDRGRSVGLTIGLLLDRLWGDPLRWHPVAGFGAVARAAERRWYADRRSHGVLYVVGLSAAVVATAAAVERHVRHRPLTRVLATAAATWTVLGGRSLRNHAGALADAVEGDDIDAARSRIPAVCGRSPEHLDGAGLVRAAVESVAENTSDAVVAPLFWGALLGIPGLVGYRAVNTLDGMIGYRTARYANFGWAAARTDDLLNVVPARLTATLVVCLAPLVGGSPRSAVGVWRRHGHRHLSPNAGPIEAATAGALGIRLGGPTRYPHGVEFHAVLGDGPAPGVLDLRRASGLMDRVAVVAAALLIATSEVAAR